jgi:enamine deaminase RidA (YjgF/YER057c/UK114 family)
VSAPRSIDVPGLAPSGAAWSQVTVAGDLVFVSGQVALDERGEVVGRGSAEEQAEQVFSNVQRAVEAAGSSMDRLVRVCVYLTDVAHIVPFRAVRDRRGDGSRPASTLVIVSALVDPDLLVEMDAVAMLPEPGN